MIIGITGTDGAGKGAVVEYLVGEKGFAHYHGRALFIQLIKEQGLEVNRANMRLVANELRKNEGNDGVVRRFLKEAEEAEDERIIIDSIRALAEGETLKQRGGVLLAVDADQRLRYERIQARASESDAVTFEEFAAHEELEMNDPDPHGMQKAAVMAAADYTIDNNGTLEELHGKVDEVLAQIEREGESS